jgi:hypothetical protein
MDTDAEERKNAETKQSEAAEGRPNFGFLVAE